MSLDRGHHRSNDLSLSLLRGGARATGKPSDSYAMHAKRPKIATSHVRCSRLNWVPLCVLDEAATTQPSDTAKSSESA